MSRSIDNPLPCPWPGAEQQGKAYLCWHCHGTGELPHFRHIQDGVCFACKGRGWQYSPNALRSVAPGTGLGKTSWKRVGSAVVRA